MVKISDLKTYRVSRRSALLGVATAGASLAIFTSFSFFRREKNEQELLRKIISKNMPNVQVNSEDIALLHKDIYKLEYNLIKDARGKKFQLVSALAVFANPKAFFERVGLSEQLEVLERTVITYFILGSDFLDQKMPDGAKISYSGYEPTCGNPFAKDAA